MRLTFDGVDALLQRLVDRLWDNEISVPQYMAEWDNLLEFAGWSEEEYFEKINEGWTTDRKRPSTFMC